MKSVIMNKTKKTTVYLYVADQERLARIKTNYGLGVSAAIRISLALFEEKMKVDEPAQGEITYPSLTPSLSREREPR